MTASPLRIVEVGPRDGLQSESAPIPSADKIELIRRLHAAGLHRMEVTSFVRADRIPQLADGPTVAEAVVDLPGLRSIALAPNRRGLEAAAVAGVSEVAVFGAASEEFSRRNINRTIDESVEMFSEVARGAVELGLGVRGYVSTVAGCPYQGDVPVDDVKRLVAAFFEMGCDEVSVADTIGVGRPQQIHDLFGALSGIGDVTAMAFHGHDTYGMGLANSLAAIDAGVATIDSSVGGLGGCPYAGPMAKGNLATEDLVYALAGTDLDPGVDLDAVVATAWWISDLLGRAPRSSVATARGSG
ncbi:MAG: hydroxymethylglutaryl-CoA lyase [Ilumatobacteraceae bacterium]